MGLEALSLAVYAAAFTFTATLSHLVWKSVFVVFISDSLILCAQYSFVQTMSIWGLLVVNISGCAASALLIQVYICLLLQVLSVILSNNLLICSNS